MIGNFDIPQDKSVVKTFVFNAMGPIALSGNLPQGFRIWNKPNGISFVHGIIIGAGSGGGGGGTGGGGGGGSSGGVVTFLVPAYALPNETFVVVPSGGTGGASNTAGKAPAIYTGLAYTTQAVITGTPTRTNIVFANGVTAQTGGGAGGAAGGTAGAVGATTTAAGIPMIASAGNYVITAPSPGLAGTIDRGADAAFIGRPQGGASGGGISGGVASAGGNVLGPTFSTQTIWNRNLLGGAATGQAGEDGISMVQPTLFNLPGAGGGALVGGTGGIGGKGGIGCGGGGGGAATHGAGGAGGDGGDGLIILTCW
jgi:hypothetical protein